MADVFEKQLHQVQMKKVKNEQMRAFKQIDAAIEKMSNQWVARIWLRYFQTLIWLKYEPLDYPMYSLENITL